MTGQLGVPFVSIGELVLGYILGVDEDMDSPSLYPASCGAGSTGGAITGSNVRYQHREGNQKWPTR
jgi:hypothetical protein